MKPLHLFLLLGAAVVFAALPPGQDAHAKPKDGRAWLGVSTRDMTPRLAREMELTTEKGALVNDVVDDSPAEKGGIKEGDVIVAFQGKEIDDASDLVDAVREASPGSGAEVEIMRDGKRQSVKVTLGKRPRRSWGNFYLPMPPMPPRVYCFTSMDGYGLHLMNLNEQLGAYFGAPGGKGVLVEEVDEKSPAEKAGFKAGDVVVSIGKEQVSDAEDVWQALADFRNGEEAKVGILRKGTTSTLSLPIEENEQGYRDHMDYPHKMLDRMDLNFDHLKIKLESLGREIRHKMERLQEKLHHEFISTTS